MKFFDQLKSLDPRDVGRWPLPVRGFFVALIFALVTAVAWYIVVWNDDRPILLKAEFSAASRNGWVSPSSDTSLVNMHPRFITLNATPWSSKKGGRAKYQLIFAHGLSS